MQLLIFLWNWCKDQVRGKLVTYLGLTYIIWLKPFISKKLCEFAYWLVIQNNQLFVINSLSTKNCLMTQTTMTRSDHIKGWPKRDKTRKVTSWCLRVLWFWNDSQKLKIKIPDIWESIELKCFKRLRVYFFFHHKEVNQSERFLTPKNNYEYSPLRGFRRMLTF